MKMSNGFRRNFQKLVYSVLFVIISFSLYGKVEVDVKKFGAKGNGINDDYISIQKAIDYVCQNNGGKVYFPKGEYLVKNQSLVVWGSNIELEGVEGAIIKKVGGAGWWGELLEISGKVKGYRYYGSFGQSSYNRFSIHKGKNIPSNNIKVSNLIFDSSLATNKSSNNVGIINSMNVHIFNCSFLNAPQTNLGIINDARKFSNTNILIDNCYFSGAGDHNLRVISYEAGAFLRNDVKIVNSNFKNVIRRSSHKELKSNRVHVWYRAGGNPNSNLTISNSKFDNTGDIIATVNGKGLIINNSTIAEKIIYEDGNLEDLKIENNLFLKSFENSIKSRNIVNSNLSKKNKFK